MAYFASVLQCIEYGYLEVLVTPGGCQILKSECNMSINITMQSNTQVGIGSATEYGQ